MTPGPRALPWICLAALLGGCASSLPVGELVPLWTAKTTDGEPYSADKLRGRPGMLVWIDPMCPEVQKSAEYDGALRKLESRWMLTDSAWVLYVAARTRPDEVMDPSMWRPWMKETKLRGAVLVDSSAHLARILGVRNAPAAVVVDQDGYMRWRGPVRAAQDADGVSQASMVLDSVLHGSALPEPDHGFDAGCPMEERVW